MQNLRYQKMLKKFLLNFILNSLRNFSNHQTLHVFFRFIANFYKIFENWICKIFWKLNLQNFLKIEFAKFFENWICKIFWKLNSQNLLNLLSNFFTVMNSQLRFKWEFAKFIKLANLENQHILQYFSHQFNLQNL